MTKEQYQAIIIRINANWPQSPLTKATAAEWWGHLGGLSFAAVSARIDELVATEEWRPSLAKILKPLADAGKEQASAALASVMSAFVNPPGQRGHLVSEQAREAVRRLGGWGLIGGLDSSKREWLEKRWTAVWEDVGDEIAAGKMLAIGGGKPSAIVSGLAKSLKVAK